MSISFTKYVDITSGVLASGNVRDLDLILRIYSSNSLIPSNSYAEFTSYADVLAYFGANSNITKKAAMYFSFLSKFNRSPQKISVASWVQTAVPAKIVGAVAATAALAAFNAITSGNLTLTLNAITHTIAAINLSAAGSLTAVASTLQTAIRAADTDTNWSGATVAWNSSPGNFSLTGGVAAPTQSVSIGITAATSPDVGVLLGWENIGTLYSYGSPAVSLTTTMANSVQASNNFATFSFDNALNATQVLELATWNATNNNRYLYLPSVTAATASAISAELLSIPGAGMTLAPLSTEYPDIIPGCIAAATDYNARNAVQNYMFQPVSGITPSVTDDADSDAYDLLRVNYYGQTQEFGQLISFYQRGVLTGSGNAPTDMNIYVNEIWLKSKAGTALMSVMLSLGQISPNMSGRATLIGTLQSVIQLALFNGIISVGTVLNNTQIQVINTLTGDDKAWRQVQTIGYWLDVSFSSSVTEDGRIEWAADYTLVYKKNDAIRKINGTHDLV